MGKVGFGSLRDFLAGLLGSPPATLTVSLETSLGLACPILSRTGLLLTPKASKALCRPSWLLYGCCRTVAANRRTPGMFQLLASDLLPVSGGGPPSICISCPCRSQLGALGPGVYLLPPLWKALHFSPLSSCTLPGIVSFLFLYWDFS